MCRPYVLHGMEKADSDDDDAVIQKSLCAADYAVVVETLHIALQSSAISIACL